MKDILVSIIIPTYNRKELLLKTVKSIQNQSITSIEILVCDDGSSDGTKDAIEEIVNNDNRVRYIDCGANGRPAIPRNIGIKNARGEWLAFCDDDDYWVSNKLEIQLETVKKYGTKACCTNAYLYEIDNKELKEYFKNSITEVIRFKDILKHNPVICSSVLIHSSLFETIIGFPEEKELRALEDYALWMRVFCFTDFVYLKEPLVYYLITSSTSIRNKEPIPFYLQQDIVANNWMEWGKLLSEKDNYNKANKAYREYLCKRNIKLQTRQILRAVKHLIEK